MTEPSLLIDFNSFLILLWCMFIFPFTAYIIIHLAKSFIIFMAQLIQKYKNKRDINIDYNRDYNTQILKRIINPFNIPDKREVKKNHGKRIPFFNKR